MSIYGGRDGDTKLVHDAGVVAENVAREGQ